jgi:hypothetical protein
MDWLLARQDAIQKKLAARHLSDGGLVLYDLSSSYFVGPAKFRFRFLRDYTKAVAA